MMASSLAEDLVCPICLAIFQEPHMLSCGHNFCLSCLRSCVAKGQSAGTCPECRRPFELGELACNRALANLAKKVRRLNLAGETLLDTATVGFCEDHDEPLKLFCNQDRVPICVICRDLPQHRGHDFLPTRNAVQDAQRKLKPYLRALEKCLKETTVDESDQQKEIAELESCTADILDDISLEFEVLHQILRKKERDIKGMVQEMKEDNQAEMEDALCSLKVEVASYTEIIAKVKAAFKTTDHVAFLQGYKELMSQIEECQLGEVEDSSSASENEKSDEEIESSKEAYEDTDEEADEKEEEDERDEEVDCSDKVIQVDADLEKFKNSLDFKTWGKMLQRINPRKF